MMKSTMNAYRGCLNLSLRVIVALFLLCSWQVGEGQVRTNPKPVGLAKAILEETSFKLATAEEENFRFHFERGSLAEKELDGLRRQAQDARLKALALLDERDFEPILDLFYISTRDQMSEIMGAKVKGWTDYKSRTIVMVYNDSTRAYHNHEVMHAVSLGLWGYPADSNHAFIEGMAVYADSPCLGYSVHEIAAFLLHDRKIIRFEELFHEFRKQDDMISYMEAGSVVQYLVETHGGATVKRIWQEGIEKVESILGLRLDDLEREYRKYLLDQYPKKPKVNWPMLQDKGCG